MGIGDLRHVVVSRAGVRDLVPRTGFVNEADLQALICASPELLGPLGTELKFLPIGWEVPVGAGRLDLLLLDSAGVVTLVETKLDANDESRRKVVGQVLEYASYAAEWTVGDLETFAADLYQRPSSPDDLRGLSLQEAAARRFGWEGDAEDERQTKMEALIARTTATLGSAHLRVVCGVDERIESLERIVQFLSAHSDLQVVLLQVNRFQVDSRLAVLIPTLHGDVHGPESRHSSGSSNRMTVSEIVGSFQGTAEQAAVSDLVEAVQRAGAVFLPGPSGFSVRVRCPLKQEPVTVAWVFAPGKRTWMKTRDITFGHGLDYDSTQPSLRAVLDAYYEDLVTAGISGDANSKGVRARWVSPDELVQKIEWLQARVVRVIADLQSLSA